MGEGKERHVVAASFCPNPWSQLLFTTNAEKSSQKTKQIWKKRKTKGQLCRLNEIVRSLFFAARIIMTTVMASFPMPALVTAAAASLKKAGREMTSSSSF